LSADREKLGCDPAMSPGRRSKRSMTRTRTD
jgi:hypothetical protein